MNTFEERNAETKRKLYAAIIRPHKKHKNHNSANISVRKQGSPGYDKEAAFDNAISWYKDIIGHTWLSECEKTPFDFKVHSKGGLFLIDVVGFAMNNGRYQLNTSHKNIPELLNYAKNMHAKACYLAFNTNETDISDIKAWRFIRIHEDMPSGNIYISKSRGHGILSATRLFMDKRSRKTIMHEKVSRMYAPRKERWEELEQWINS